MKDVYNYIKQVNEMARTKGSKNKPKENIANKPFPEDPKKLKEDPRVANAISVKDAAKKYKKADIVVNGKETSGKVKPKEGDAKQARTIGFTLNAADPKDFLPWDELKAMKSSWNKNERALTSAVKSKRNFLIFGKAGWAKTQSVLKVAGEFGYDVITVYLNHAVASDLGGIPIPTEDENGNSIMDYAIPGYCQYMLNHPDNKFILFFDEINQAAPDVLNGLMPIALEHVVAGIKFEDQIIVAGAGNLDSENDSLNTVNAPLLSRFKVIDWEINQDSWESHFEWAHKKYDSIIGKKIIDMLQSFSRYWRSPRDITMNIYDWMKENKDGCADEPEDLVEMIMKNCVIPEDDKTANFDRNSRQFNEDIKNVAQYMYDYAEGNLSEKSVGRQRSKESDDTMNKWDKEIIMNALVNGYYYFGEDRGGDNKKYVTTQENCYPYLFNEEIGLTAEVYDKILRQIKDSGREVKYKTNAEGKKGAAEFGYEEVYEMGKAGALVRQHATRDTVKDAPAKKERPRNND